MKNLALALAGSAVALIGLLHIAIAIGGPSWYAFFGAPLRLVQAARAGDVYAPLMCVVIAVVCFGIAAYTFGAGMTPALPFTRPALGMIAAIFLLRGIAFVPMLLCARPELIARVTGDARVDLFAWVTSAAALAIGLGYTVGAYQVK